MKVFYKKMIPLNMVLLIALLYFELICVINGNSLYFGKPLGRLSELDHGVSGEVFAVDSRTLHLVNFIYDGQGPGGYFYAGNTDKPSNRGFPINDENGNSGVLRRYRKENITLTLPNGKNLNDIKWFSVWCKDFNVNFGHINLPKNFKYPRPLKIDGLQGVHDVSSDPIIIVDAQTLLIPNFSYDGEAPDAKFWVGPGPKPRANPYGIRLADENGTENPLKRYNKKTIVLTLPNNLTIFDIGHFGVWCEKFTVDFGHVKIPEESQLNIPPSLKMLKISPQSKLNCEVLYEPLDYQVRWAIAGDYIVIQLLSKLESNFYMAFGLSGDESKSIMIGGDVAVAWFDENQQQGYIQDYFLQSKSQCSGPKGSCPDRKFEENANNLELRSAVLSKDYTIITYQRPLKASDIYDKDIHLNRTQAIIWAIGPLNERNEVSYHPIYLKEDHFIDFGRSAKWNCPLPSAIDNEKTTERNRKALPAFKNSGTNYEKNKSIKSNELTKKTSKHDYKKNFSEITTTTIRNPNAWFIPPIQCDEPEDGVFYAQMGPTGGKYGYAAITGHVGWGISWYINGLLIPEIHLVRGKTYTFVIEGGSDTDIPAKYHPFYITDDPVGGYYYKTEEEKKNVKIFAGVEQDVNGELLPTGVGRYCRWVQEANYDADEFKSFGAFQRTLNLKCDVGEPGVISWTPDKNTPNVVYYQCFTHRYLGWKIIITDTCDPKTSESQNYFYIDAPNEYYDANPSIIYENKIQFPEVIDTDKKFNRFVKQFDLTKQNLPKFNFNSKTHYKPIVQTQRKSSNVSLMKRINQKNNAKIRSSNNHKKQILKASKFQLSFEKNAILNNSWNTEIESVAKANANANAYIIKSNKNTSNNPMNFQHAIKFNNKNVLNFIPKRKRISKPNSSIIYLPRIQTIKNNNSSNFSVLQSNQNNIAWTLPLSKENDFERSLN